MSSIQSLRNGDLQGALSKLQAEIRDNPAEPKHRIFLFQLLCVLGQWDRALNQLNILRDISPDAMTLVQAYQETLVCEALRAAVFSGARSPLLFGEPEPWMAMMLQALQRYATGAKDEADSLRTQALEQAPTTAAELHLHPLHTGQSSDVSASEERIEIEWISDADSRIGPFLEAIVKGKYYWIPFQRIQTMVFEKATDLRDLVWLPARFAWSNGGEAVGFVPARYPSSESSADDHIRLGWKTVWNEDSHGVFLGQGQRILTTDIDDYPLTRIGKVVFQIG